MTSQELYKDIILDHHRDPRNFGELGAHDFMIEKYNPLCGDHVRVEVKLDENGQKVADIAFKGEGCSISMASASILTEEAKGKPVREVLAEIQKFRDVLQGQGDESELAGDVEALSGVKAFPVRIKCALLPWTALKEGLETCEKCGGPGHVCR